MRRVKHRDGREHVELTPREARQGRPGRPVLHILIGLVIGTAVGVAFVLIYLQGNG